MTREANAHGDMRYRGRMAPDPVRGTVLVVDDNAENRALAKAALEDEDIPVVLAATGEQALAAFAEAQPMCVLRDELQRLQLHKEQLSAFLVHDLKNPVNSIALHVQRILRNANADERSRDAAAKIQDETRGLLRMITHATRVVRGLPRERMEAVAGMVVVALRGGGLLPQRERVVAREPVARTFGDWIEWRLPAGEPNLPPHHYLPRLRRSDEFLRT